MNIGKAIKMLRERKGFTLNSFAEKANITTSYLKLVENYNIDMTINTLKTISSCLNTKVSVIVVLAESL